MPKTQSSSMKTKMVAPGSFDAKDFVTVKNIDCISPKVSEIAEVINLDGGSFEIDSSSITGCNSSVLVRLSQEIRKTFALSETRVYGFKFSVFSPGCGGVVDPAAAINGGRFVTILGVPECLRGAKPAAEMIAELVAIGGGDEIAPPAATCEVLTFSANGQGGATAASPLVVREGAVCFIPFGYSQMIGASFDSSHNAVLPSSRPGGRPINIKKNPTRRIVVVADVVLTGTAVSKTVSLLADINDMIAGSSQEKRNKYINALGHKLITEGGNPDDDKISVTEIAGSLVKLLRSNAMVKATLMTGLVKALGGKDSPNAKAAIEAFATISSADSVGEAIEKMKDLMMSNETIARLILKFMGKNPDANLEDDENTTIPETFDD